jgi:amino acid transporter
VTDSSRIGTGLFVSTGTALAVAGPCMLIIVFIIAGLMLFCTCRALGELAVLFPVPGSFIVYFGQFIDPAWGFALGWRYVLTLLAPRIITKSLVMLFLGLFGSRSLSLRE